MKAIWCKNYAKLFILNGNKCRILIKYHSSMAPMWYNENIISTSDAFVNFFVRGFKGQFHATEYIVSSLLMTLDKHCCNILMWKCHKIYCKKSCDTSAHVNCSFEIKTAYIAIPNNVLMTIYHSLINNKTFKSCIFFYQQYLKKYSDTFFWDIRKWCQK